MNHRKHPLFGTWCAMLQRCNNIRNKAYPNYGGRGINVCEGWQSLPGGFWDFVRHMGNKPNGCSIDRIDNNKGYFPENCRWATKKEQQRNQRNTRTIFIDGVFYKAADLSEKYGLKADTIINRCKAGLSFNEVISPIKRVYKEGLALGGAVNGERQRNKTHCKSGHEYKESNVSRSKEGWRRCKQCHRDNESLRRANSCS